MNNNPVLTDLEKLCICLNELSDASTNLLTYLYDLLPKISECCGIFGGCPFDALQKEPAMTDSQDSRYFLSEMPQQVELLKDGLDEYKRMLTNCLKELHCAVASCSDCKSEPSFDSAMSLASSKLSTSGNADESNRRALIEATVVSPNDNESNFTKIIGLCNAKQIIRQALVMPMMLPNLFTGVSVKPWNRMLLYGPPGTGKTELARALASEIQAIFFSVSSSDIVSCMLGESEKFIKELFSYACCLNKPSVIFIDEIDSLARSRSSTEEDHIRRIKTELLVQLSQLERRPSTEPPVMFIGATNLPWEIDCGIMRRFQKRIYIPLPNSEARSAILKMHSALVRAQLTESEIDELVKATCNFTPHDIIGFVQDSFFQRIAELETAKCWLFDTARSLWMPSDLTTHPESAECSLSSLPVTMVAPRPPDITNFRNALATAKPTVASDLIARFNEFTEKFGINGE